MWNKCTCLRVVSLAGPNYAPWVKQTQEQMEGASTARLGRASYYENGRLRCHACKSALRWFSKSQFTTQDMIIYRRTVNLRPTLWSSPSLHAIFVTISPICQPRGPDSFPNLPPQVILIANANFSRFNRISFWCNFMTHFTLNSQGLCTPSLG